MGYPELAGFVPSIRDYGLGAGMGTGGRCGFAGKSLDGDPALFYEFRNMAEVRAALGRGPAVEQLEDLFDEGFSSEDRELNVQSVIYREIDDTGEAAGTEVVDMTGVTGDATYAVGGVVMPELDRTYAILFVRGAALIADNIAQYLICRNYDVVDPNHRVWEGPYTLIEDAVPGTATIYLEAPNAGPTVVATTVGPADVDVDDLVILYHTAPVPTGALTQQALTDLAQWRDALGNPIGGTADVSIIGTDQPQLLATWDEIQQIATDEWNDNFHPVLFIISVPQCPLVGVPGTDYDIDTWVDLQVASAAFYRGTTIPTDDLLNGSLSVSAIWVLRQTSVGVPGGQTAMIVRHQTGALVGQAIRSRWHWDAGWLAKFNFKKTTFVYPWNSDLDNMTFDGANEAEYRTTRINDEHMLIAWPRVGYMRKIALDSFWAMCDNLSDYFKAPYYRIVGGTHVVLRIWFNNYVRAPGLSSNDAAMLEAACNGEVVRPRIVDPKRLGDPIIKPYNDAYINIWAEADVLVTELFNYGLRIVPTGSLRQLTGWTQLVRSL
jgi:hypothetical protein